MGEGVVNEVDLDAYFGRIGWSGEASPSLATLHALSRAHVEAIPFENLDVLLGRGVDLADAAVDQKLIHQRRGGYCFEQNTLFLRVLTTLGFVARPLSARVRVGRAREETPPRTHVFVRVELDEGSYLVDVGVGGLSLTGALRLELDTVQATPHEPRRIVYEQGRYFHQAALMGPAGDTPTWVDVCEFTLEEMPAIDREIGNWYTSAHPRSHFRSRLLAARALPDGGRVTLLNRELSVRRRDGLVRQEIRDPDGLLLALSQHFGLTFPVGTRFDCPGLDWPGESGA